MEVRITCIIKPGGHMNAHEAISHYGWWNELSGDRNIALRQDMVEWAKRQGNRTYVKDGRGNKVYCYVNKSRDGTEFLQTYRDGTWTDNLLALDDCPRR